MLNLKKYHLTSKNSRANLKYRLEYKKVKSIFKVHENIFRTSKKGLALEK